MRHAASIAMVTALTVVIGAAGALGAAHAVRPATNLASGLVSPSPSASPSPTPIQPPPTPPPPPGHAQVVAPSTKVAWALMDYQALFLSTDQGNSWDKRSLPVPLGGRPFISFVDQSEGWLLMPGSPATQCEEAPADLWRTTDGATTWQRLNISGVDKRQCKDGIWFIDTKHGFISASDPNHPPTVYRTSDGGATWTASTLADPPDFKSSAGGFELSVSWIKSFGRALYMEVSDKQTDPTTSHQYVFTSADGASWTWKMKVPPREPVMVTESRLLLLTGPGTPQESLNGGQQWHPYTTDLSLDSLEFGGTTVVFADSEVGYETGNGALQRTSNGGAQWVRIPTPGTQPVTIPSPTPSGIPIPTDAVLSAPSSAVWALVARQFLFRSTDEGASWQGRMLPAGDDLYGPLISFVDGTTGFVMFRSLSGDCTSQIAELWSTSDGGTTWQIANGMPTSECKDALFFTDVQHGLLSTGDSFNGATIWRTQDGGHTWVKAVGDAKRPAPRVNSFQAYGTTVLAYAPPFVYRSTDGGQTWSYVTQSPKASKTIGFVTSSRWIELISPVLSSETTDGGQSWHSLVTDYSQAEPVPPQIVFADAKVGYATGGGQIQRTLDGGVHWEMIKTSWP